jgi:hypothetical protein
VLAVPRRVGTLRVADAEAEFGPAHEILRADAHELQRKNKNKTKHTVHSNTSSTCPPKAVEKTTPPTGFPEQNTALDILKNPSDGSETQIPFPSAPGQFPSNK